jgi:hypothetical protein
MTQMMGAAQLMQQDTRLQRGLVAALPGDGSVCVDVPGADLPVSCQVLQSGVGSVVLVEGDEVLVWLSDAGASTTGVVLGRVAPYADVDAAMPREGFDSRPRRVVIDAQEEIILRNRRARLRLSADGDIELIGESFSGRCRRVLRLLAPLIKLN